MKKSISRKLRVAGCFVLTGALLLTSCNSKNSKEPTNKTKKTKKTEATTENPDRYTGEQAGIRLHELDEETNGPDEEDDDSETKAVPIVTDDSIDDDEEVPVLIELPEYLA